MSNVIPSGSIVTYTGHWPHTELFGFGSVDGAISDVTNDLLSNYQLYSKTPPKTSLFGGLLSSATGTGFSVTLQLEVDNGLGFASKEDIISAIRASVLKILGDNSSSDSIPYIQIPGSAQQATGEPNPDVSAGGCIAGNGNDTSGSFSVSCWFKNLTTTGFASVGALAILAIVGIGIFIFAFDKIPSLPGSRR